MYTHPDDIGTFDGAIRILEWMRDNGWQGSCEWQQTVARANELNPTNTPVGFYLVNYSNSRD